MVNIPKTRKTFCAGKECNKHTVHKVTQYKAGKASLFAQGTLHFYPSNAFAHTCLYTIIKPLFR